MDSTLMVTVVNRNVLLSRVRPPRRSPWFLAAGFFAALIVLMAAALALISQAAEEIVAEIRSMSDQDADVWSSYVRSKFGNRDDSLSL